ncbi:hypothetical protein IGI04_023268, partial [Brassica rapa subsp. trilocularis]
RVTGDVPRFVDQSIRANKHGRQDVLNNLIETTNFPVLKLVFPGQLDILRPTVEQDLTWIMPDLTWIMPDLTWIMPDLTRIMPDLTWIRPDLAWVVKKPKTDMHSHPADHPDSPASVLIFTPCIHLVRMNLDILTSLLHFRALTRSSLLHFLCLDLVKFIFSMHSNSSLCVLWWLALDCGYIKSHSAFLDDPFNPSQFQKCRLPSRIISNTQLKATEPKEGSGGEQNCGHQEEPSSIHKPDRTQDLRTNLFEEEGNDVPRFVHPTVPDTLTEPSRVCPNWSFGWNHDQTTEFHVLKLVFPDQLDILRPTVEQGLTWIMPDLTWIMPDLTRIMPDLTWIKPDLAWVVKKPKSDMHSHPADHPDSPASVLIFTPNSSLCVLWWLALDRGYIKSHSASLDDPFNPSQFQKCCSSTGVGHRQRRWSLPVSKVVRRQRRFLAAPELRRRTVADDGGGDIRRRRVKDTRAVGVTSGGAYGFV